MEYIIAGAIAVAVIAITATLMIQAFCQDSLLNPWMAGFLVWSVFVFAGMIAASAKEEQKGPCLRYETSMYWNAATKTMMPARVCVERAEWVN